MSPRRWTLRGLLLWLGLVVPFGLLLFAYHYLEVLASRGTRPVLEPLITELTGAFVGGVLFFPVRRFVRRLPLTPSNWPRRLPVYVLAILVLGPVATTLMWGARAVLFPLAGLGRYDYGVMPLRYLMELPLQEVRLKLKSQVAELGAGEAPFELRGTNLPHPRGLQSIVNVNGDEDAGKPDGLFNALNTISATMYDDPAAADEMLDQLAELLRASLRTAQSDEVPLGEELALLDRYLALLHARFGSRLEVDLQLDSEAAGALVPSLFLQPLVENAIRHGNAERAGRGVIAVRARRDGEKLILEVEDDGPGDQGSLDRSPERQESGLGLSATAERLRLLYGEAQTFSAGNGERGGFVVRACLPFRTAEGATA
ncbi:MAG TPA: histidine kinase [Thermoanaerobaculia bacterium]|nr:histidine kinase [Thermoanaerobaculia bacterium]